MRIKTSTGKVIFITSQVSNKEMKVIKNRHANRYTKVYNIEGEDIKKLYAVECSDHGWFTITKKGFKAGGNCPICARNTQKEKASKTMILKKSKKTMITKICDRCSTKFEVKNTSKKSKRKLCDSCIPLEKSDRMKKQNIDKEFRRKKSELMKSEYKNGKRIATGGRSNWIKYNELNVQGEIEFNICKALDILKEESSIFDWDYTNDRIPYNNLKGSESTYLLDFKVFITKDFFFYIESKGYAIDNDLMKWSSVLNKGFPMKVFFQRTHMQKIINDPHFILSHKFFSKKDIEHISVECQNDFKIFKVNKEAL